MAKDLRSELSAFELGWLVALLEGEGHFGWTKNSPKIQLRMTDEDTVNSFARIVSKVTGVRPNVWCYTDERRPQYSEIYVAQVMGDRALAVMRLVVKHMHSRRRACIWRIINGFRYEGKVDLTKILGLEKGNG